MFSRWRAASAVTIEHFLTIGTWRSSRAAAANGIALLVVSSPAVLPCFELKTPACAGQAWRVRRIAILFRANEFCRKASHNYQERWSWQQRGEGPIAQQPRVSGVEVKPIHRMYHLRIRDPCFSPAWRPSKERGRENCGGPSDVSYRFYC